MELQTYVNSLQEQLANAAGAGGEQAREVALRLAAPLETATRLVLLEALAAAAGEITGELAPGSVEVRLRGRNPEFVVSLPPARTDFDETPQEFPASEPQAASTGEGDEGGTSRFTLRLPEHLKQRIEAAAAAEKLSVNSWLVRSLATSLEHPGPAPRGSKKRSSEGRSYSGWVQ
jgi:hypothetical protein